MWIMVIYLIVYLPKAFFLIGFWFVGLIQGIVGLQAVPVEQINENFENTKKEVINMPFGDGTGPAGAGPMTGRAAGFCAGILCQAI